MSVPISYNHGDYLITFDCLHTGGGSSSLSGSPWKFRPGPLPLDPNEPCGPALGLFPNGPMGSKRAPGGTDPLLKKHIS
jgi:hypothetical protein